MYCDVYGAALTYGDIFTCFLYNMFGGDFTFIAIAIVLMFLLAAWKFHISSTIGLVIAWPVVFYLSAISNHTNYPLVAITLLLTIAIAIKAFISVLGLFQK